MRVQTFAAVLYAILRVDEVAAAAVTQHIQRAIAEQAVEIVGVGLRMAGEIFAFSIAEEGIVGAFVFHIASLAKTKCGGRPSQHRSVKKVLRRPARGYVYSLSKAVYTKSGKEKSPAPRAELQKHRDGQKRKVCVLLTASVSPQSVKHQTGRSSGSASLSAYLPNQMVSGIQSGLHITAAAPHGIYTRFPILPQQCVGT